MEKYELYNAIYVTIKLNKGITINQLSWLLSKHYEKEYENIKKLVEKLMYSSEDLPRCIDYHIIPKEKTKNNKEVIHLKCSEKSQDKVMKLLSKHREFHGYEVPLLTIEKRVKHAAILKET